MLASIFIVQGYNTMRHPDRVVKKADPVVRPIAERVSFVPDDTEQAVRLNGAIQLAAGTLLALGWLPRLSALTIAGTLVPTTAAGHRFWEFDDDQERAQQRVHFLKNVAMFGGLLIAAGDTACRPSLAWRSRARRADRPAGGGPDRQDGAQVGKGRCQGDQAQGQAPRRVSPPGLSTPTSGKPP